ncbi:MAG: FAD-dependent oxidoreductase [Phyllobacterium sp.]
MVLSIAIVGAGPSGCYLAQTLGKTIAECQIDVIDQLVAPYGLVRYGVAPDHQGTKGVIRQFARLFERENVGFFGNLRLGEDFALDELRALYDVVILATGLSQDRSLGLEGEELNGVMRAGDLTRWWNDHPFSKDPPALCGPDAVVMGNGNVAIDVVRLLAKSHEEFDGSDLGPHHHDGLIGCGIRTIHIVGRSDAGCAKFDPVMIKELGRLAHVRILMSEPLPANESPDAHKGLEALGAIDGIGDEQSRKTIRFHFGWTPTGLTGQQGSLTHASFRRSSGEGDLHLACNHFITAIGFEDDGALGRSNLLENAEDIETGKIEGNLYACGWFRRGPTGTIPENRADAIAVARRIEFDLAAGKLRPGKPGRAELASRYPQATDYSGWTRIDAAEIAGASASRCRQKIVDHQQMLSIAKDNSATQQHAKDRP